MHGDKLNVAYCKSLGIVPRVHGNGFIQVDHGGNRLNFWGHPDIPRQTTPTPIHNHRFKLWSECLKGRLVNVEYKVQDAEDGDFETYEAVCREGEDTELKKTGARVRAVPSKIDMVVPGPLHKSGYTVEMWDFHETFAPEPTITVMKKSTVRGSLPPLVLVPHGQAPDNSFDRNAYPVEELWRIIQEILDS